MSIRLLFLAMAVCGLSLIASASASTQEARTITGYLVDKATADQLMDSDDPMGGAKLVTKKHLLAADSGYGVLVKDGDSYMFKNFNDDWNAFAKKLIRESEKSAGIKVEVSGKQQRRAAMVIESIAEVD